MQCTYSYIKVRRSTQIIYSILNPAENADKQAKDETNAYEKKRDKN